jgi:hypothetical protein
MAYVEIMADDRRDAAEQKMIAAWRDFMATCKDAKAAADGLSKAERNRTIVLVMQAYMGFSHALRALEKLEGQADAIR